MQAAKSSNTWERYAWVAGLLFVAALVAETIVSIGIPLNQDDSATKIAAELQHHRQRILVIVACSIVYAVSFLVYLGRLNLYLRKGDDRDRFFGIFIPMGGALFIALHAVSDIGIDGLLAGKLASYSVQHDPGLSYTLYLLTFALDSVGDVLGSVFLTASGLLVLRKGALPRWLGWIALVTGTLFIVQGFGLGGVIATFGLVLDLIGFLGLLIFVAVSSVVALRAGVVYSWPCQG